MENPYLSKAHALAIRTAKLGMIRCIFVEKWTSGKWTLSGFVRSRPESLWWFEVDFWPLSVHFRRGPPPFSESTCPQRMARKFGNDRMYIRGEWALRRWHWSSFSGTGCRVISDGFLAPIRAFSKGAPHHFPKANALRYGHRKFGEDVYENGPSGRYRLGC